MAEEEAELAEAIRPRAPGRGDVFLIGASVAIVIVSSTVMERSAETIGKHFGLSDLIVGGVILAAVTSLPNAVGAVFLATRGRGAAVLSEAMNSNMINVVVGLLLPGLFIGLGRPSTNSAIVVAWYAGLTVVSLALVLLRSGLTRIAGVVIVAIYFAFLVVSGAQVRASSERTRFSAGATFRNMAIPKRSVGMRSDSCKRARSSRPSSRRRLRCPDVFQG